MPKDEKATERKADDGAEKNMDVTNSKRKRAPDQDVLPGIIGKQLRAAYGEMLNAPIPDTISDLIKRLESQEGSKGTDGRTHDREESDQ